MLSQVFFLWSNLCYNNWFQGKKKSCSAVGILVQVPVCYGSNKMVFWWCSQAFHISWLLDYLVIEEFFSCIKQKCTSPSLPTDLVVLYQDEGTELSGENTPEVLCPSLGPWHKKDVNQLDQVQVWATKMDHLSCEDRLRVETVLPGEVSGMTL